MSSVIIWNVRREGKQIPHTGREGGPPIAEDSLFAAPTLEGVAGGGGFRVKSVR